MTLIKPSGYRNLLENVENTEKAIKHVKDMFRRTCPHSSPCCG